MSSVLVSIAEAVKDGLNTEIVGLSATRVYKVDIEREELSGRQVYVVPAAERITPISRAANEYEYDIDIGVFRPVADVSDASLIDAGMDDVESILALFGQGGALRDSRMGGAAWQAIDNSPAWDPIRLEKHIFASRVRLTYVRRD